MPRLTGRGKALELFIAAEKNVRRPSGRNRKVDAIADDPVAGLEIRLKLPIELGKSAAVRDTAERLYAEFAAAGIEVLLDDRDERPGVMFADIELLGIPHRIVVGERGLKQGQIEYQGRRDKNAQPIALADAVAAVKSLVCS